MVKLLMVKKNRANGIFTCPVFMFDRLPKGCGLGDRSQTGLLT